MKEIVVGIIEILKESAQGWSRDNASFLAAAITYYTIFALAPLLVIAVAVAGAVFNDTEVRDQVLGEVRSEFGPDVEEVVLNLITNASKSKASRFATVASTILLLIASSGLFAQLQRAMNMIWGIRPNPEAGVLNIIRKRILAFGMVLGLGLLLLLSVAMSTIITAVGDRLVFWLPAIGALLPQINFVASLVILTGLFAILFKVLPDALVNWRDVLLGGAVTTLLFLLGRSLIALYLTYGSATSTYGAAGSLVVVLLWVYYSAQIFLFGAEFTQVYANKYGSPVVPASNAVWRINHKAVHAAYEEEAIQHHIVPPEAPPVAAESEAETAVPHWRHPVAMGLYGLAAGLLLGLLGRQMEGKK